jgi:hypothetical protein
MCNNVRFEIWPPEKMGMDCVETRRDVSKVSKCGDDNGLREKKTEESRGRYDKVWVNRRRLQSCEQISRRV